jgi:2'-5' RNA ligase
MPYAITLRTDEAAASQIRAIWRELAARGISDEMTRLGYVPHLTMAILPDGVSEARLITAARECASWRAMPIRLAGFNRFPGNRETLFLAPVVTPALLDAHAALHVLLEDVSIDPYYSRDTWVPHVTLASDLTDAAAAMAALPASLPPIDAVLDTLDVVRFRPVEILSSHTLNVPS